MSADSVYRKKCKTEGCDAKTANRGGLCRWCLTSVENGKMPATFGGAPAHHHSTGDRRRSTARVLERVVRDRCRVQSAGGGMRMIRKALGGGTT